VAQFYFDVHDDGLIIDDEGLELPDLEAVQHEATRALAGLAWDKAAGGDPIQQMGIAVRDKHGR
jgi:hypothetical protein